MERRVPARLSSAEGRKFGFTVGLAFAAVALLLLWRDMTVKATVVGALAAIILFAALVVPTHLGPVERAWMGLAGLISKVTTPVFMGVVYFLVITPIGRIRRLAGWSALHERERKTSNWRPHAPGAAPRDSMEHQF